MQLPVHRAKPQHGSIRNGARPQVQRRPHVLALILILKQQCVGIVQRYSQPRYLPCRPPPRYLPLLLLLLLPTTMTNMIRF
jgi:hypothetical protein